jgi:signal peptidase II
MSIVRSKRREVLLAGVALVVFAIDQISKALVARYLTPLVPWNPIGALTPYFSLTYVTNTGAAFGLFPQLAGVYPYINLAIVAGLLFFYRRFGVRHWLLPVSLGLQTGGALGNLADRLRLGYVIDFFDIKIWPVSNVADICIVAGVCILAVLLLRQGPEQEGQASTADGAQCGVSDVDNLGAA